MIEIDSTWTLFLDRDGVINHKINDGYVTNIEEFRFEKGAKEAICTFSKLFHKIIVVTNQQCVGKGIITHDDLKEIHAHMTKELAKKEGRIDQVYYAPQLAFENSIFRKPNPGMAFQAKKDFPEIDFNKSILIGDSISDLAFAKNVGMKTIFISNDTHELADYCVKSLEESLTIIKGAQPQ